MKIISIDIGIKNLSFCLFDICDLKIIKWDNINLSEKTEIKCAECDKSAKFYKNTEYYCLKHSKKHPYLHPTNELKQTALNKLKLQQLIEIADKYKLTYESPPKKTTILDTIIKFVDTHCYKVIEKINATKVDLVTIGRNIQQKFDDILREHFMSINTIIIENQIGPLANKMKTIQGMISQYFIMKNNNIYIEFISASNKLKDYCTEKMDYKQRKKLAIKITGDIMMTEQFNEWLVFFEKHAKKDDLSDCFLQGLWFIKHKI